MAINKTQFKAVSKNKQKGRWSKAEKTKARLKREKQAEKERKQAERKAEKERKQAEKKSLVIVPWLPHAFN